MPLFARKIAVADAAAAIRAELDGRTGTPLAPELLDLSRLLRRLEAEPLLVGGSAQPGLQELLDALPDGAGVLDGRGRIGAGNVMLDEVLGPTRARGRTLLEATRSAELAESAALAISGKPSRGEVTLPAQGRLVLAMLAPLSGARAMVVLRDLTETKRRERMRRDFIANASHELRTPVAAISGAVETLLGPGILLDDSARGFIEMISRHADRLTRLTRDLLDLSRLESGEWKVELTALEIAQLCESAVTLFREKAAQKQITLGCDAPETLQVLADRRAVEQILVNLLDNAIKFTPEGGRVTLLADDLGSSVSLAVIDTGAGIEPRHQQRIFERFYRADPGRAREAGGTGLGLAIVKHLAQAQGGEVGVDSGAGGSRFWVKLRKSASATSPA